MSFSCILIQFFSYFKIFSHLGHDYVVIWLHNYSHKKSRNFVIFWYIWLEKLRFRLILALETSYASKFVHNFDKKIEIRLEAIGQVNYFFDFLKSTILKKNVNFNEILLNLYESPK